MSLTGNHTSRYHNITSVVLTLTRLLSYHGAVNLRLLKNQNVLVSETVCPGNSNVSLMFQVPNDEVEKNKHSDYPLRDILTPFTVQVTFKDGMFPTKTYAVIWG